MSGERPFVPPFYQFSRILHGGCSEVLPSTPFVGFQGPGVVRWISLRSSGLQFLPSFPSSCTRRRRSCCSTTVLFSCVSLDLCRRRAVWFCGYTTFFFLRYFCFCLFSFLLQEAEDWWRVASTWYVR